MTMPRLRVTASLSLLALVAGTAGTGWLSTQTAGWRTALPSAFAVTQADRTPRSALAVQSHIARHHRAPAVAPRTLRTDSAAVGDAVASVDSTSPAPALIPVSMPADGTPYDRLRGHLNGRVVLQLAVDGMGRVRHAAVARSSGDPILDTHALTVVYGWRFAVPPNYPAGFSSELPMRFDTEAQLARTP